MFKILLLFILFNAVVSISNFFRNCFGGANKKSRLLYHSVFKDAELGNIKYQKKVPKKKVRLALGIAGITTFGIVLSKILGINVANTTFSNASSVILNNSQPIANATKSDKKALLARIKGHATIIRSNIKSHITEMHSKDHDAEVYTYVEENIGKIHFKIIKDLIGIYTPVTKHMAIDPKDKKHTVEIHKKIRSYMAGINAIVNKYLTEMRSEMEKYKNPNITKSDKKALLARMQHNVIKTHTKIKNYIRRIHSNIKDHMKEMHLNTKNNSARNHIDITKHGLNKSVIYIIAIVFALLATIVGIYTLNMLNIKLNMNMFTDMHQYCLNDSMHTNFIGLFNAYEFDRTIQCIRIL